MKAWVKQILWQACDPKRVAVYVPAGWSQWLIRIGAYLQAIGRECYHQCDHEKQCTIDGKLEKVYGPHKT